MKKLFIVAALIALTGCEPVPHYNRLSVAPYGGVTAKKPYGTVKVYRTAKDIDKPYDEVGFMSCEGSVSEEGGILNAMLYRAADMGADAILLNPPRVSAENTKGQTIGIEFGWMAMIGNGDRCAFRALAIRFK